jgi:sarcosine oxidase, subunit gamma
MTPRLAPLQLRDVSGQRRRFGCKGPAAESWLSAHGFAVAAGVNRWAVDARGVLVARLATSEFLIEADRDAAEHLEGSAARLAELPREPGVYPVAREDFSIDLHGATLGDFLLQTCSVNFAPLLRGCAPDAGEVLLTSMIGVGVVVIVRADVAGPRVTIWSDPSYSHYFWNTVLEVVRDLGGGVAGRSAENHNEEPS